MEMLIGLNSKLYRGAAGGDATTEIPIVGTVKLGLEVGEATLKIRASNFELSDTTFFKISLEFDLLWDESDSNFTALWNAFTAREKLSFKCLSKTSGKGLKADFKIFKFERNEDPEQPILASVAIKPTIGQTPVFV
jgi:hypothetical protein